MGEVVHIDNYREKPCLDSVIRNATFAEIRQLFDEHGKKTKYEFGLAGSRFVQVYHSPGAFDPENKDQSIYTIRTTDDIYVLIDGKNLTYIDPLNF